MSGCNLNGLLSIDINLSKSDSSISINLYKPISLVNIDAYQKDGALMICVPNVDSIRVLWSVYGNDVVTIGGKYFGYVIFK